MFTLSDRSAASVEEVSLELLEDGLDCNCAIVDLSAHDVRYDMIYYIISTNIHI